MTVVRPVPPEIIDEIIARVWPNTEARVCALVCRDWLPASRRRLLHTVSLWTPGKYSLFMSRVVRAETLRPYLSSVRRLTLGREAWGYEPPVNVLVKLEMGSFVPELAGLLPNLESLSIRNMDYAAVPPHPHSWLALSHFHSVWVLRLTGCSFPSFQAFRLVLTALPTLTFLEMTHVRWNTSKARVLLPNDQTPCSVRPRISTLCLNGSHIRGEWPHDTGKRMAQQLVAWLSVTATAKSLRSFTVDKGISVHYLSDYFGSRFPLICSHISELTVDIDWSV